MSASFFSSAALRVASLFFFSTKARSSAVRETGGLNASAASGVSPDAANPAAVIFQNRVGSAGLAGAAATSAICARTKAFVTNAFVASEASSRLTQLRLHERVRRGFLVETGVAKQETHQVTRERGLRLRRRRLLLPPLGFLLGALGIRRRLAPRPRLGERAASRASRAFSFSSSFLAFSARRSASFLAFSSSFLAFSAASSASFLAFSARRSASSSPSLGELRPFLAFSARRSASFLAFSSSFLAFSAASSASFLARSARRSASFPAFSSASSASLFGSLRARLSSSLRARSARLLRPLRLLARLRLGARRGVLGARVQNSGRAIRLRLTKSTIAGARSAHAVVAHGGDGERRLLAQRAPRAARRRRHDRLQHVQLELAGAEAHLTPSCDPSPRAGPRAGAVGAVPACV